AIDKLGEEAKKANTMVANGGLAPVTASTTVRIARGQRRTTDGPYTETKEAGGGFARFDLKCKKETIKGGQSVMEVHIKHRPGWEGATEIRQICGPEDFKDCASRG